MKWPDRNEGPDRGAHGDRVTGPDHNAHLRTLSPGTTLEASIAVPARGLALDLTVSPGRTLALVGPNGAGKSTALQALAGLIDYEGTIRVGDRSLDGVPPELRRVGLVFQDYLLFPHLSALENVAFGPRSSGIGRVAARATATEWLERFDMAHIAHRRPAQLSGGQQQRVALARALASEPSILLLDEPLAALDVEIRDGVRAALAGHIRDWGGRTIVVTHSFADVAALATDVVVLENGRATQRGTIDEIAANPATAYVRRLVSGDAAR